MKQASCATIWCSLAVQTSLVLGKSCAPRQNVLGRDVTTDFLVGLALAAKQEEQRQSCGPKPRTARSGQGQQQNSAILPKALRCSISPLPVAASQAVLPYALNLPNPILDLYS